MYGGASASDGAKSTNVPANSAGGGSSTAGANTGSGSSAGGVNGAVGSSTATDDAATTKKKSGKENKHTDRNAREQHGLIDSIAHPGANDEASNKAMTEVPSRIMLGNSMSMHEQQVNNAIREMVEGYFAIVKGNVADQVPKAITLLMISRLRE